MLRVLKVWSMTSSFSINWDLVRNANSRAHFRPTETELWEWGRDTYVLTNLLHGFLMHAKF